MPVTTKLIDGKHRVVEEATGKIVTGRYPSPVDGGGHDSQERARRQADAINVSMAKKENET